MTNSIDNILKCIEENETFLVTSHVSPDGDNLGSTLATFYALKKLGKKVFYVLDDTIPLNMNFLVDGVEKLSSQDFSQTDYVVITLDCGDKNRICIDKTLIDGTKVLVTIDHHASNNGYGDINFIDTEASSTCELVYRLLSRYKKLNGVNLIDEKIATALYTGIVTDTGNFSYTNADEESFEVARNLLMMGAKKEDIIINVFQSNSFNYYKLLGEALNTLEVYGSEVACITLTKDMLDKNDISYNDVDGITTYTRDIKGINIGILFKQRNENEVKVSLRSKNNTDVSKIAQVFGGGGHTRAAGCTIADSVDVAKKKVLDVVLNILQGEINE